MKMSDSCAVLEILLAPCLLGMEKSDTLHVPLQTSYERLLELQSEEGSVASILDVLDAMHEEPFDLNLSSEMEFEQIPGLGPLLAHRIVAQRSIRPFQSIDDLARVEGITPDLLRTVDPFITVRERGAPNTNRFRIRTRVARSAIGAPGSAVSQYPGSPDRMYSKLTARVGGSLLEGRSESINDAGLNPLLSIGLVTEKDPGERNYLDFVGGHMCVTLPAIGATVVLGDFSFEAGQGLVHWRSGGLSIGSEATSGIARTGIGIRPSFSVDQGWVFRGAAATVDLRPITLSTFISDRSVDGNTDSNGVVTRFDLDGLHRTAAEMQGHNKVRERACGARAVCELMEGLRIGVSGLATSFDKPVSLPGAFGFRGNGTRTSGLDVSITLTSLHIFGEIAQDVQESRAAVLGMVLSPRPEASIAVLARMYPRSFLTLHGAGFSENGLNSINESGFYCGILVRPASWLNVNAHWDVFANPWRLSSTRFPSNGNELFMLAEAQVSRRCGVEVQLRHKERPSDVTVVNSWGLPLAGDENRIQRNYRMTITVNSLESLVWKTRLEVVSVSHSLKPGHETGLLTFQDFSFVPLRHTSLAMRVIAFDTPSFDSRLYEYEEEVPGCSQTPALYGTGFRWFCMGWCQLFGRVGVSIKYSQTWSDLGRNNAYTSGNAQPDPDNRLTIQVDVRL